MKRGKSSCQIVCGADTGQDFIDDADVRALCGNKASAVSQKNNQSDGTHVRGFTAHVRAGNDVQTMLGIEIAVIRYIVPRSFLQRPGAGRP